MLNFNKTSIDFYLDYVNRELYKSKFTLLKSYDFSKIVFINKVNRSTYWFPLNSGRKSKEYPNKLRSKIYISKHTIYNFDSSIFLSSLELFINSKLDTDVSQVLQSERFQNYLSLVNEVVRKTETKRHIPRARYNATIAWKYRRYGEYNSLKYYLDYEPHRTTSRIRRLNFFAVYAWFPQVKHWIFTFRNMRTLYFRWRKLQKFEHRFFRIKGMSFRYWAKRQLQHNYLNSLSSDTLTDPYNSNFFNFSQLAVNNVELNTVFCFKYNKNLHATFIFWLLSESIKNVSTLNLTSYFSNTYNLNQPSHTVKYRYLKNFFSYSTPKYAHAYYRALQHAHGGWAILRNFFSLLKPTYWNLKDGLDFYPHEYWEWESALWWEDTIPFYFSRFLPQNRKTRFLDLDLLDGSNSMWFYKSWFHEEMFMELQSSYYKTYYNIDYLTPNWRIFTDYPKRRLGHFDPNWRDRMHEYVIYQYMNLFHPSTKRYYIDYSSHPEYVSTRSFFVLNFSWKPSVIPLFLNQFRPKSRKVIRSANTLSNPVENLKPNFKGLSTNFELINFFPVFLLTSDNKSLHLLVDYDKHLTFLINIFNRSHLKPPHDPTYFTFLFTYLSIFSPVLMPGEKFVSLMLEKSFSSHFLISDFLITNFFLSAGEWLYQKDRIIAEYVAFKRFFSLLTSEYSNIKQ